MLNKYLKRRLKIVNARVHEVNKYHQQFVEGLITLEEYINKIYYVYNKAEYLHCKNRLKEFKEGL